MDGQRKRSSLATTNLFADRRNGIYIWRRVHEKTGKRLKRSTGTRLIKIALAKAQEFEDDYQRGVVGLTKYDCYRRDLQPFVEPFLASLSCQEDHRSVLDMQLNRAFARLRLRKLADLENFIEIEKRLMRLEGEFNRGTLARCFQGPLKQFSKYLVGKREIPNDHLADWPAIEVIEPPRERKALSPELMARALFASDCLDKICLRIHPMRPVWTALLIAAPRISAMAALDVPDFDRGKGRFELKGCGNKRVGAGTLDDLTRDEIVAYVGARKTGPLFLSPHGCRVEGERSIDYWRAAVSMAAVDFAWPSNRPRDLRLVYLVHLALISGRIRVAMGGQVNGDRQPGAAKRKVRDDMADLIGKVADEIREKWLEQMRGVDQHCLRMTHRTWALVSGVPEVLIDRQLGHTSAASEAALRTAWSAVGRKYYTDMGFLTFDAKRSAIAVRGMLEQAVAEFHEISNRGETALRQPEKSGRLGIA